MPRDTLIEIRQGTTQQWADADIAYLADITGAADRILAPGEPGQDTDTGEVRWGSITGRPWSDIPQTLGVTGPTGADSIVQGPTGVTGVTGPTGSSPDTSIFAPISGPKFTGTAAFSAENTTTGTTTTTLDWNNGNKQKLLLNANITTMSFTSPTGPTSLQLKIVQGGNGVTGFAVVWPSTGTTTGVKWSGGTVPTLTAATGAVDMVSFYYDGLGYWGQGSTDFK